MITGEEMERMSKFDWWASVNEATYEAAAGDVLANGGEPITVPYRAHRHDRTDHQSSFEGVDWDAIARQLNEADESAGDFWFAQTDAPESGATAPLTRFYISYRSNVLEVLTAPASRTMRYLGN
ncbi:hypothetical protein [Streptomyces vinaceus]|uniref:hypothetical protein n=1 Tax=Streptomyces vinaceus TaxID=1960 RepID=UPI003695923E